MKLIKYFSMISHSVKMNERGTLTIPAEIRKELNLNKEIRFKIFNDDGTIILIPIYDLSQSHDWIKKGTFTNEKFKAAHQNDLEVEKRI